MFYYRVYIFSVRKREDLNFWDCAVFFRFCHNWGVGHKGVLLYCQLYREPF